MILELFDTVKGDPVRDWPAYNTINLDEVDRLIGIIGPTVYNPVFSSITGSTAPNIGADGTVTGVWYRVLDVVFAWGLIHWSGAGLNPGSGANWYTISLPVPILGLPASINIGVGAVIGQANCRNQNDGTASQPAVLQAQTTTTASFSSAKGNTSGAWRHDVPFTWEDNDRITWSACYRSALI